VFCRNGPDARGAHVASFGSPWLRASFGLPVDEDLHTGILADAFAHALTRDNHRVAVPGVPSDECLASVVQIATLRPHTPSRVLAASLVEDVASLDDVTEMRHAVHPLRFGVGACRRFAPARGTATFGGGAGGGAVGPVPHLHARNAREGFQSP
jgi:hypothetical protein